jgi:hypothetical protein
MLELVLFAALSQVPQPNDVLPPVTKEDLQWFPPNHVVKWNMEISHSHAMWIQQEVNKRTSVPYQRRSEEDKRLLVFYQLWSQDAWEIYGIWTQLFMSQTNTQQLVVLRVRIGPQAYYRGMMPPPVPLEYFRYR